MDENDTIVLETERLTFRLWTLERRDAMARLASNPDIMRYIADGQTWSRDTAHFFAGAQWAWQFAYGYSMWPISLRGEDTIIGVCGLMPLRGTPDIEIGWWLEPTHWGCGLISEGALAVRDYGFERAGLKRIVAIAQEPNKASFRIMEKIGMRYEKVHGENNGNRVLLYGIARPD